MGSHHPIRKTVAPEPVIVPDKLYFRIGDVATLCDVPAYVLRFWETEFPQLKPNKGGTGQRLYRKRDVEIALRIKSLLYDQGYTIPGARLVFRSDAPKLEAAPEPALVSPVPPAFAVDDLGAQIRQDAHQRDRVSDLRAELQSLAAILRNPITTTHRFQTAIETQPSSTPRPLRPRLMLEPKLVPALHLNQGDLFTAE